MSSHEQGKATCNRLKDHDYGLPVTLADGRSQWRCRWCGDVIELSAEARERVRASLYGVLREDAGKVQT